MSTRFDLELFTQLNKEYEDKRLVPRPRTFDAEARALESDKRTDRLDRRLDLRGKRVLEIGCGTGGVGRQLAERFDCTVVGIDIDRYDAWSTNVSSAVTFVQGDISDPPEGLGQFDAMFSFSVWEHLVHPYAALQQCFEMLEPGGQMFLQAQLHRGPKASHRYREVFFPWPHLLFTPDVFEDYYVSIGEDPKRPAWVNKLTSGQYVEAFKRVGYVTRARSTPETATFDDAFYQRFHDQLAAYPRWDLRHDVLTAVVERPGGPPEGALAPPAGKTTAVSAAADIDRGPPVPISRRIWRAVPASIRDHRNIQRALGTMRRSLGSIAKP